MCLLEGTPFLDGFKVKGKFKGHRHLGGVDPRARIARAAAATHFARSNTALAAKNSGLESR